MSALILSPFFHPEPISTGRYNTVLAQCLAGRGEAVCVIASHPLYPKWRPAFSDEQLPQIATYRGGAWMRYPKSAVLRRLLLESWFAVHACWRYLRLQHPPQHVIPVFPPGLFMLLLAPLLARGTRVTGIVHDLQGVHAESSPSAVGRALQGVICWIEKRGFLRCDRLVFLSRSMAARAIRQYGLDPGHCVVCYPFLTLPPGNARPGNALAALMPDDLLHVVYSGALGDKQSPDALLAFMAGLGQRHSIVRCHVFSAGPHFDRLRSSYATQPVAFHDLVPEQQVEELYARSSVQLIPQADGTANGSLPSKLPNLLAAGVPIFAICEDHSEVSAILDEADAGVHVSSFKSAQLSAGFEQLLLAITKEPRADRISRLRSFVADRFSVDRVADAILEP